MISESYQFIKTKYAVFITHIYNILLSIMKWRKQDVKKQGREEEEGRCKSVGGSSVEGEGYRLI